MSQYAYILVVLSLVFLFLLNKYEKERLQRLYQEQLLKDETFRSDIKEKIHTTENINDVKFSVIFYIFSKWSCISFKIFVE